MYFLSGILGYVSGPGYLSGPDPRRIVGVVAAVDYEGKVMIVRIRESLSRVCYQGFRTRLEPRKTGRAAEGLSCT